MNQVEKYRHVPYDIEVEQAILGSFIITPDSYWRVAETLKPENFYDPLHQRIFDQIAKMCAKDQRITPLTIHATMKNDPGLHEVGGHAYLVGIVQAAPAMGNVRDLAKILRALAVRRAIIAAAEEAVNSAYDSPDDVTPEAIAERLGERVYEAARTAKEGNAEGAVPIRELAYRAVQSAENARNLPAGVCLTSGLWSVDQALGGIYRGDLTILGGAPSMGKTSLAQHIAYANGESTEEEPAPEETIFYSLEMLAEQVATRDLAMRAKVPSDRMRRGKTTAEEIERLALAASQMPDLPYRVDGSRRLSVAQMRARTQARKRRSNRGVKLVVIDHLRFIRAADPRADEKDQIQQITSDLKDMAAELNVAVLCISHVSREYAKRGNFRPQLNDLYGSSAIEQNADAVWFVHREIYYLTRNPPSDKDLQARSIWEQKCEAEAGKAEIFAAKQRMGAISSAKVNFEEKYTQYSDLEEKPTQEVMDLWELTK